MMLDAFRVDPRHVLLDTQRTQEAVDDQVTPAAVVGEVAALAGEEDRAIGFGMNQAVALQAADRVVDGGVGDTQPVGEVNRTRLALRLDQIRDQLDIVLGDLVAMIAARAAEGFRLLVRPGEAAPELLDDAISYPRWLTTPAARRRKGPWRCPGRWPRGRSIGSAL